MEEAAEDEAHAAFQDLTPQEGGLMTNTRYLGPWCLNIANCRHFEACFPSHTFSTKSSCSQCLGTDSPGSQPLYTFPVHNHPSCDTHLCLSSLQCSNDLLPLSSTGPVLFSLPPSLYPLTHPVCTEAWQHSRLPWLWFLLHRLLQTAIVSLSTEAPQAASQPTGGACRPSGGYERDIPRSRFWLYNFPFRHLKSVLVKELGRS